MATNSTALIEQDDPGKTHGTPSNQNPNREREEVTSKSKKQTAQTEHSDPEHDSPRYKTMSKF